MSQSLNAKKPFLTGEQIEAILVIAPMILLFIGFIIGSFMLITSPYGG